MSYKAKDGKQFGNRQKQRAYDERQSTQPAPDEHETPEAEGETHGETDTETPIHEFIAQHGPAQKIDIRHDHEAGKHEVTSHHSGKKHHSTHPNAEAAHMHAAKAAGLNQENEQEQAGYAEPSEQQSYAIPGM
jgi:hypothetical protein